MKKNSTTASLFDWMDQKQNDTETLVPQQIVEQPKQSEQPVAQPTLKSSEKQEIREISSEKQETPHENGSETVTERPLVVGVDAMNLVFQLYYALPKLTSPNGEPVGVIRGFLRDLLSLRKTLPTQYLFVAFDLPDKTFRHRIHETYKANRPPAPEDLISQILKLRPLLATLGIPVLAVPGFEADDLLATLAEQSVQHGRRCVIVTADKDCRQLLHEEMVRIYMIRKKRFVDVTTLREEWGVMPFQVVDYLSLVGDAADNVPGVLGIGPKSAQCLLNQFGSIERMMEQLESVTNANRRKILRESTKLLERNRTLIQLRRDVPCELDWDAAVKPVPQSQAAECLTSLGLAKLIPDFCGHSLL